MGLIFDRQEGSNFIYTDEFTGEEQSSPQIIANAKGNPAQENTTTETTGKTNIGQTQSPNTLYTVERIQSSRGYEVKKGEQPVTAGEAVRSRFNKWTLFKYLNHPNSGGKDNKKAGTEHYTKAIQSPEILNPTAKTIVQATSNTQQASLGYSYTLTDFVQCEHYGMISNNHLITLRRFPYPVPDDIISPKRFDESGQLVDAQQPDLARAISWLSPTLGNDIKDLMSFGVGFNWEEVTAEVQTAQGKTDRGKAGSLISGNSYASAIEAGVNGYSATERATLEDKGAGYDPLNSTYPNAVYGPLNVIDSVLTRKRGLKFDQEFKVSFYYDIRGYGDTSSKVAFMDTLANLLVLTYNNAPFWGGAVRYLSSGIPGQQLGDYKKLQSGDYAGYLKSIVGQFADMGRNLVNDLGKGLGDSKVLDNLIGGELMKLFGGPQGADTLKAFLTGDPTGQWHLTVGNPLNPMLMVGNLAMSDAKFEFEGPLGYEDFPTKLKVTITLKHGRPRDKGEIESMFNAGRGRIYLQPEVSGVDVDQIVDISAYGNKDRPAARKSFEAMRRASDMSAG